MYTNMRGVYLRDTAFKPCNPRVLVFLILNTYNTAFLLSELAFWVYYTYTVG